MFSPQEYLGPVIKAAHGIKETAVEETGNYGMEGVGWAGVLPFINLLGKLGFIISYGEFMGDKS